MRKKILIADKDASLKEAFRIIFSEDMYEILYAASAKEVEKLATSSRPDIYIVNVNLLKSSGIEVYRKLQKDKFLDNARFFFLKDENDSTELLGFQAEGVIEKPINFFKVHERIAKDEDLLVLVEEVEETPREAQPGPIQTQSKEQQPVEQPEARSAEERPPAGTRPWQAQRFELQDVKRPEERRAQGGEESGSEKAGPRGDAAGNIAADMMAALDLSSRAEGDTGGTPPVLEVELRRALNAAMEEIVPKLAETIAPVLSRFVEGYTRRILYEIAEKVIREEINKLLKESAP